MGNAGSNPPRERSKSSSENPPSSPLKEGEAFIFDKKPRSTFGSRRTSLRDDDNSNEEEAPYFTKASVNDEFATSPRPRSNTVSEGTKIPDDPKVLPTVFKWEGGGKQVFISGTFTEWKTLPMVKSHGDFVTIIDLPEGEHQFKFFVDGEWRHDPTMKIIDNGMGSKNNLVSVKQSDFEVFKALAKDSENISHASVQSEYSQEIPQMKPWDKVTGPPILPPHLLQVILNKDTPLSCEPTLLPEPNHVMLNHLYALSIKDGVMVLSATHRKSSPVNTMEASMRFRIWYFFKKSTARRERVHYHGSIGRSCSSTIVVFFVNANGVKLLANFFDFVDEVINSRCSWPPMPLVVFNFFTALFETFIPIVNGCLFHSKLHKRSLNIPTTALNLILF